MRSAIVCLLTLILSSLAWGDPGITLPPSVQLQPGRLAKIEATTTGKTIRWLNPDPDNLDLIASESGKWVIIASPRPGTYRVAAYTAIDGEPTEAAVCVITVAQPKPPDPPVPPTPPQPTDPLAKELRALYASDPGAPELKRQTVQQLALFYRAGSLMIADRQYATVGQFHAALKTKAPSVGDALMPLRSRLGAEMAGILGADPAAEFTVNRRGAGEALLSKIAGILETLP